MDEFGGFESMPGGAPSLTGGSGEMEVRLPSH